MKDLQYFIVTHPQGEHPSSPPEPLPKPQLNDAQSPKPTESPPATPPASAPSASSSSPPSPPSSHSPEQIAINGNGAPAQRKTSAVDVESLVPSHDEQGRAIPEWKRQVMVRKLQVKMQEEEESKRKVSRYHTVRHHKHKLRHMIITHFSIIKSGLTIFSAYDVKVILL